MNIGMRQELERKVAIALISEGLKAGYSISVDNGEEEFPQMTDQESILKEMFSVDEERLNFYKDGKFFGQVFLVYGNDGWDAVCDYHTKLEHIMDGVNERTSRETGSSIRVDGPIAIDKSAFRKCRSIWPLWWVE